MHHARVLFIYIPAIIGSINLYAQQTFDVRGADSIISAWKENNKPGGAVAVLKNGKTIYRSANGMANVEKGRPIAFDTQFWIASVTKQFTAAAIYLLAEENKITLKDPVTKHLPNLPKIYNEVTLDHLLHHTSGIRDGFVLTALSKKPESEYTNDNVLNYLIKQKELNFKPGEQFEYNNSGYVLLALVIEKASKETYPEFMQLHIFVPAGMHNTFVTGKFENNEILAEGYRINNGSFQTTHFSGNTYGSTGIITTLRDLELWAAQFQSLSTTNRFNSVFRKLKETAHLNNGHAIAYGGGVEKLKYKGMDVFDHFGADEGFKANIIYFPSSNVSVIGLTNNMNEYQLSERLYALADLAIGQTIEKTPNIQTDTAAEIHEYFDGASTTYRKIKLFSDRAEVNEAPGGNTDRYTREGEWLIDDEVIPLQRLQIKGDKLLIDDIYYDADKELRKNKDANHSDPVSKFAGEYYSEELGASYTIQHKNGELLFEFYPGATFPLTRISDSTFIFEYVGANYITFTRKGLLFSREGVRNLKLNRK